MPRALHTLACIAAVLLLGGQIGTAVAFMVLPAGGGR